MVQFQREGAMYRSGGDEGTLSLVSCSGPQPQPVGNLFLRFRNRALLHVPRLPWAITLP
jgi:hypothetical protein